MKSDSLNSSVESEDSGLGWRILNPKQRKRDKNMETPKIIAPSLQSTGWKEPPIVVSGQTTTTHMPVKSTAKISATAHNLQPRSPTRPSLLKNPGAGGSGHLTKQEEAFCLEGGNQQAVELGTKPASSEKETLKTSPQSRYLTMTSLQEDFPARVFPLLEGVKAFKTSQGELFSLKSAVSLEIKDHRTYSLRMLKDYFLTTQAEPSQLYSFRWMNLGTMSNGKCSTLSIGYRKTGKGSLSSVLEEDVDEKYYLSKMGLEGLMNTVDVDAYVRVGERKRVNGKAELTSIAERRIRPLTPTECERLQGFPDGWTGGVSDTQRYKQMGNALSIPVVSAIGKAIIASLK